MIYITGDTHGDFRRIFDFYESGNMDEIKVFVYENGIDGIEFNQMLNLCKLSFLISRRLNQ